MKCILNTFTQFLNTIQSISNVRCASMANIKTTLWPLEAHTKAKHDILKRYLQAWYPILGRHNRRIVYIDGFSGPGRYEGGEMGSPIIAINAAIDHKLDLTSEIVFWFIEENKSRYENLNSILSEMTIPPQFKLNVECSTFENSLSEILDDIDRNGSSLAPTFAFIDPFGISDTPFSIIEKIMSYQKCEVLITFMSGFVNRFKGEECNVNHIDRLFGTTDWQHSILENGDEEAITEFYQERLQSVAKYVRSFEMINDRNQTVYRLIFGTNSIRGLEKMKESMWNVDESGSFKYSDRTDPNQSLLFSHEPNFEHLKSLILSEFEGVTVTIEEIKELVLVKTPFRETHFKTQILTPMEIATPPEIQVLRAGKSGYPGGTQITFLSQESVREQKKILKEKEVKRQASLFDF